MAVGNRSLHKTFNDTLDDCQDSSDSFLLIFDNIDDTSSINPGNLIEYCEASCREKVFAFISLIFIASRVSFCHTKSY